MLLLKVCEEGILQKRVQAGGQPALQLEKIHHWPLQCSSLRRMQNENGQGPPLLLGARTLLGASGLTTSSKEATRGSSSRRRTASGKWIPRILLSGFRSNSRSWGEMSRCSAWKAQKQQAQRSQTSQVSWGFDALTHGKVKRCKEDRSDSCKQARLKLSCMRGVSAETCFKLLSSLTVHPFCSKFCPLHSISDSTLLKMVEVRESMRRKKHKLTRSVPNSDDYSLCMFACTNLSRTCSE